MQRPLIGITCGSSRGDSAAKTEQDRLNSAYSRAIWLAGGMPLILPNLPGADPSEVLLRIDGLVLSGGADIDPVRYSQLPLNETVKTDPVRDEAEIPLVQAAVDRDLPILGI